MDPLPPASAVFGVVQRAFSPFLIDSSEVSNWDGASLPPPADGLHLVYVYGHAWLQGDAVGAAWRRDDNEVVGNPGALLAEMLLAGEPGRTLLYLDCCHAEAVEAALPATLQLLFVAHACGAEEKAIALVHERATRFSLALASEVSRAKASLDLAQATAHVARRLEANGVLPGQSVGYRMHGPAVRLTRGEAAVATPRERAAARVRNALVVGGAVVALAAVIGAWFYWTHLLVDVDMAGLPGYASNVRLRVFQEDPGTNSRSLVHDEAVGQNNRLRFWAPAADLIVEVHADYPDQAERAINFHTVFAPGFDLAAKRWTLALPAQAEVQRRAGMAYVFSVSWFHGRERELHRPGKAYWIELRPPTVQGYEPFADRMLATGVLKQENSYLLSWRRRSSAIDAVGLQQLRPLGKALGDIIGVIDAANSSQVTAPGDIVIGTGRLPCPTCPAPMTRLEAGLFCEQRGLRLPTDLEWELAVRGVDGRDYPWGARFDPGRANVPGLPAKGAPAPALKPVDAYASERSPFGLIDTVGNAGDWVVNESGGRERVYMGATYRFNPEDATAFRMLPVTEEDAFVRETTARCAIDAAR